MAGTSATYDPDNVSLTVGTIVVTGFAGGTDIAVTPSSDSASKKVGSRGDVIFNIRRDESAQLRFTLMRSSPSNPLLQVVNKARQVVKVLLKDNTSGEIVQAAHGIVMRRPDTAHGDEAADKEWVISLGPTDENHNALPALG